MDAIAAISKYPIKYEYKKPRATLPYVEWWMMCCEKKYDETQNEFMVYQEIFTTLERAIEIAEECYETSEYSSIKIINVFLVKD